jgi:hypothetical protein
MRTKFVRSLFLAFAVFSSFFAVEFFLEWWRLGYPGTTALSWAGQNNAKLVDLLSPVARAYNNILAMLLATIGLAIPLTANMHTPKLIDMFFRDKINQVMLYLMAFGAANDIFVDYVVGPQFAPVWAVRFAVYFALAGWAMLIPYFFYVIRFLDPSNILARLKDETLEVFGLVRDRGFDPERAQDMVIQRVFQIGTIVLKSLDRADRGVAQEGVWTLKTLLDSHGAMKSQMPAAWFKVDRKDFVGHSDEAIEMLNADHTWFEMKALTQLYFAYQAALSKSSDVVSSVSDAVRVAAEHGAERGDEACLGLAIRFFNNFVRDAMKRKDVLGMYDVFAEYRLLARNLAHHPKSQRDIARYIRHYARSAKAGGSPFVEQLAAFELGYLARRAYESKSPAARDLLDGAMAIANLEKGEVVPLVVEAKLLTGAFFVLNKNDEEAKVVLTNLADVPPAAIVDAERALLSAERCYFEVTDRQENMEYVRPDRREPLRAFVRRLVPEAAPPA